MSSRSRLDQSRLYEIVTRLTSIADFPATFENQEFLEAGAGAPRTEFADCGKIRVLSAIIGHCHATERRLMVLCREVLLLDSLEVYFEFCKIPFVRITGLLGMKRLKLEDLSPEAKSDQKVVVLAQFQTHPVNWLSMTIDVIVTFDGAYNPMYYFSHGQRKPRKRDCLVVRLLTADSHDAYLTACADHADESVSRYDIIKAAALSVMRPVRELVERPRRVPLNGRFDALFAETGLEFHRLFSDGTPPDPLERAAESPLAADLPHRRVRVGHFRVPEGESIRPRPPHGAVVVRRRKHRHRDPLRLLEVPAADRLCATADDREHVWSARELSDLFLLLSWYAWGQWERLCLLLGSPVSPAGVRECSHAFVDLLLRSRRSAFPWLDRVVQNSAPGSVCLRDFPLFVAAHSGSLVYARLTRIESLLMTTLLVSCSSDPLRDIPVCGCPPFRSALAWTDSDDRRLLWAVWQGGLSALWLDCDAFALQPDALCGRFEALAAAARSHSFAPPELPHYAFPPPPAGPPSPAVLDALRELGLIRAAEVAGLTGIAPSAVAGEVARALLDVATLDWVDFFERLRANLRERHSRAAEDRQFLATLSLYGTGRPAHSDALELTAPTAPALRQCAEQLLADADSRAAEPRFDANGGRTPVLPALLGPRLFLLRLGAVEPRFADADYIYPVGFASQITFWSVRERDVEVEYESAIGDGGAAPVFRVTAVGDPEVAFEGGSPDAVWCAVALAASKAQGRTLFESVRTPGADMFGIAAPLAIRLVQALPGAERCEKYQVRAFRVPYFALQKNGVLL